MSEKHTHSDFDDFTVEAVQHNYDISGICRGIGSIVPEKSDRVISEIWTADLQLGRLTKVETETYRQTGE